MKTTPHTNSLRSIRFRSEGFHKTVPEDMVTATASQEKLRGFDQSKLHDARIFVVGAGGIGNPIVTSIVRKGAGHVEICDADDVELGNLGRQGFYFDDIGKNKAECTARNAIRHASWPTEIVAHRHWFQDVVARRTVTDVDAVVVGPDNDPTRVFAARYFYPIAPVLFVGVGEQADHAYVFCQKPGEACFGCLFPEAIETERHPCPGTPAMIDILHATTALVLTAMDSILMSGRKIHWNYWDIYPSGAVPTRPGTIRRRKDCPICGTTEPEKTTEKKESD